MKTIYSSHFRTEIGTVSSFLASDSDGPFEVNNKGRSIYIKTKSHIVELIEFKISNDWIPDGMHVEDSNGWIWQIEKVNDSNEKLIINCAVIEPSVKLTSYRDTGEWLDALEIDGNNKVLHIGTEDSEMLHHRAKNSDYMPKRFTNLFDDYYQVFSFTEYLEFGFKTIVSKLKVNEKIYFHYLSAINSIKPSKQYPDEQDVSTWYAVDKTKEFLKKALKI